MKTLFFPKPVQQFYNIVSVIMHFESEALKNSNQNFHWQISFQHFVFTFYFLHVQEVKWIEP